MTEYVEANGHVVDATAFRRVLIAWGRQHFRTFKWRLTNDPFRILMAELMLHRTQAKQVESVYRRFIIQYPNIRSLAGASKAELHASLYSLGLRWRIDLLHTAVARLLRDFSGRIPKSKEELLAIPGISEYIAAAVRCFAHNIPEALVDTNTVRVAGRLFDLQVKDSSRRNASFRTLLVALLDHTQPRSYSYALLDLAEEVCTRKRPPACDKCPVSGFCVCGAQSGRLGNGRS